MKELLTDTWHVCLIQLPYGPWVIRVWEKQGEEWKEVMHKYCDYYDLTAKRDFEVLCRMVKGGDSDVRATVAHCA